MAVDMEEEEVAAMVEVEVEEVGISVYTYKLIRPVSWCLYML